MGEKEIMSPGRQYLPSSRQSRVEGDPQQSRGNPRFVLQLLSDQWERGETWENLEGKAMTEQQEKLRQQARVNSQFMGAEPATGLKHSPPDRTQYPRNVISLGLLTLHYDPCCRLDGSLSVAGIAVVLPLVREGDVLNEESSRAGDSETGILR